MEKKYYLEGLDCANCANKIETRVKSISYINSVSLNFIQKTLSFNLLDDKNSSQVLDEIKAIVNNLEPDVKVLEDKALALEGFNKFKIIRVILGIAIFILAILFKPGPAVSLIMFLTSYFIIGYEVLWRAIKNIFSGQFMDENFLMCLATVGAFLIGEYSEGVAVMIFYQIGEAFQDMAVDRSRNSIKELMDIRPDYANIIISGSDESKKEKPENVKIGDLILIKPGEKIPLDSIIVKGSSSIDTKALTGESIPLNVGIGDSILSGGININGVLVAEVAKGFGESTVSKILGLVENASSKKSATENFITGFAKIYTPVVVSLAAIIAFIVPFILSEPFSLWVSRALVFLVISCPCALVLSVPLSYFAGIGAMSKKGI
ncbi:MAG: heavy metal translocating P-type ATPase, partial [Clostridiales bacterium]|nr:heavy metal translocating P-type ATPase [Clostridiales bacterium]